MIGTSLFIRCLGVVVIASLACLVPACGPGTTQTTAGLPSRPTVVVTVGSSATTALPSATTQPTTASTSTAPGRTATVGGVVLDYPAAWFTQANGEAGLTIAQRQADLAGERPGGPRFVVEISAGDPPDIASLVSEVVPSGADPAAVAKGMSVVADPQQIQLADRQAALIVLQDGSGAESTISCYVIANLNDGKSVLLTLQTPADQWDSASPALQTILQSLRFSTPNN